MHIINLSSNKYPHLFYYHQNVSGILRSDYLKVSIYPNLEEHFIWRLYLKYVNISISFCCLFLGVYCLDLFTSNQLLLELLSFNLTLHCLAKSLNSQFLCYKFHDLMLSRTILLPVKLQAEVQRNNGCKLIIMVSIKRIFFKRK